MRHDRRLSPDCGSTPSVVAGCGRLDSFESFGPVAQQAPDEGDNEELEQHPSNLSTADAVVDVWQLEAQLMHDKSEPPPAARESLSALFLLWCACEQQRAPWAENETADPPHPL